MKKLGKGLSCASDKEVIGELVFIKTVQDVIALFDNAKGRICAVEDAGTTTLGPILQDLSGVICTTGGSGSHLAIVSREYDLPCIMALDMKPKKLKSLDGKNVKIVTKDDNLGILYLVDD